MIDDGRGKYIWGQGPETRRTAKITTEHEVEDEEAVLVILKRVPQVDDERMVNLQSPISLVGWGVRVRPDLLEKPSLLDDIPHRLHLYSL